MERGGRWREADIHSGSLVNCLVHMSGGAGWGGETKERSGGERRGGEGRGGEGRGGEGRRGEGRGGERGGEEGTRE